MEIIVHFEHPFETTMKTLFFRLWLFFVLIGLFQVHAVEVTVEGRAAGNQQTAREQALADALREAVRVGVGVDVLSQSSVENFVLEYDRIMSSAFGHVKTYRIISSGMGADEIYRVKVTADVEKGAPDAKNIMALRQVIMLKGSPRVSVSIEESIDGSAGETRYAQGYIQQIAKELQMSLVDLYAAREGELKRAKRDALVGDQMDSKIREADITQKSDFSIEGKIVAKYVGQQSFYGSLPQHVFSVGGELRAIRPETGEVVAAFSIPGTEKIESELESKEMAARDVIQKVLAKAPRNGDLPPLMNQIFARWVTECDLGALKRVEFSKLPNEQYQNVSAKLKEHEKVASVWQREFDSKGISALDVESRLDAAALGSEISKYTGGKMKLDRYTENFLIFVEAPIAAAPPKKPVASKKKGWWPF